MENASSMTVAVAAAAAGIDVRSTVRAIAGPVQRTTAKVRHLSKGCRITLLQKLVMIVAGVFRIA
jgi:hypothetical protein